MLSFILTSTIQDKFLGELGDFVSYKISKILFIISQLLLFGLKLILFLNV